MALPTFEDWQAPWEVSGKELDPAQIKKHHYNVLKDKEKAQAARDAEAAKVTELTGKVTELESKLNDKGAENLSELQKLQKSLDELSERAATAELEKTRLEVMTTNNIDPKAAEFLVGKTKAELDASAAKLVELGLVKKSTTDGETPKLDEQGNPIVTQPVVKERHNSGDPKGDGDKELPTVDDFLKSYDESHQSVF